MWRSKVARVAKSVTLRAVETKCYQINGDNSGPGGGLLAIPLYSNGGSTSGATGPWLDFPLRYIDVADGITERNGNRITLKGMHIHAQIEGESAALGNTHVRISLAWVDPNSAVGSYVYQNLYDNAIAGSNTTTNAFLRHGTDANAVIRKVLYDKVFALNTGNLPTGGSLNSQIGQRLVRIHIPFHNKLYQFINAASGIGGEKEDLLMFATAFTPGQANTVRVANVRLYRKIYYKDP